MLQLIHPAARSVAAATLLGAALVAGPARAASLDQPAQAPVLLAQATSPTPSQPSTKAKPKRSPADRVDAHIKRLHDQLKITPAQEPQWNAVAQAMRDNAQQMQGAIQQRQQAAKMTAVDDLKAYQAIADAHSQGLQKLIPAFQALYATMSDDQKKNADTVFGQHRRHARGSSK